MDIVSTDKKLKSSVAKKRIRVLHEGLELMWQNGYHASGVQEIVDKANIPKGSFYAYFENKEQFSCETLDLYMDKVYGDEEKVLEDKEMAPLRRIQVVFDNRSKKIREHELDVKGCLLSNLCHEINHSSPLLYNHLKENLSKVHKPLIECLREAILRHDMTNKNEPEEIGVYMDSSWRGALLSMKMYGNNDAMSIFKKQIMEMIINSN